MDELDSHAWTADPSRLVAQLKSAGVNRCILCTIFKDEDLIFHQTDVQVIRVAHIQIMNAATVLLNK